MSGLKAKKLICILLCVLPVLAISACAKKKGGNEVTPAQTVPAGELGQTGDVDFFPYIKYRIEDKGKDHPGCVCGMYPGYFQTNEKSGLKIDADYNSVVKAGEITDEIKMYSDEGTFYVRMINTKAEDCTLAECTICSVLLKEDCGDFTLNENMYIGKNTYDEIYHFYSEHNLYRGEENTLIYKINDGNVYRAYQSVFPQTSEIDGIFGFEDGVLKSIRLEAPEYLYYELRKNADAHELELMGQSEVDSLMKQRNEILSELEKAFKDANVDVTIDKDTGLLAMNNDVLFDTGSYELKASAKDYIDSFFKVYTSVLFNPELNTQFQTVKFVGHTDTQGDYDLNMNLSTKRAQSVLEYCIKDSAIDDSVKEKMASLATAEGKSYDEPIYDDNGEVDMAASRRVEINFVIKTNYTKKAEAAGVNPDAVPSKTARGQYANVGYNLIDPDLYENRKEECLLTDSGPVVLVGDAILLRPGAPILPEWFDQSTEQYTIADPEIGSVESKDNSYADRKVFNYYFRGAKAGKTRVSVFCQGGKDDYTDLNQFTDIRVFDDKGEYPLTLVPNKEKIVFKKGEGEQNVKFTLCGDYSGDVWAFVYSEELSTVSSSADWIDPTTLSVDTGYAVDHDCSISVILTPAGNLDKMLGWYRIPVEVVKEKNEKKDKK